MTRFGKPEKITKSRKTIVRFINRKSCKKVLLNRKKLAKLDNENTKIMKKKRKIYSIMCHKK